MGNPRLSFAALSGKSIHPSTRSNQSNKNILCLQEGLRQLVSRVNNNSRDNFYNGLDDLSWLCNKLNEVILKCSYSEISMNELLIMLIRIEEEVIHNNKYNKSLLLEIISLKLNLLGEGDKLKRDVARINSQVTEQAKLNNPHLVNAVDIVTCALESECSSKQKERLLVALGNVSSYNSEVKDINSEQARMAEEVERYCSDIKYVVAK